MSKGRGKFPPFYGRVTMTLLLRAHDHNRSHVHENFMLVPWCGSGLLSSTYRLGHSAASW